MRTADPVEVLTALQAAPLSKADRPGHTVERRASFRPARRSSTMSREPHQVCVTPAMGACPTMDSEYVKLGVVPEIVFAAAR
jgi:hypothetical protein